MLNPHFPAGIEFDVVAGKRDADAGDSGDVIRGLGGEQLPAVGRLR